MKCKEEWRTDEWHKVRESIKGLWKTNPDKALNTIKQYVGNIQDANIGKLCVVCNYFQGTLFRTKQLNDDTYQMISPYRTEICTEYKKKNMKRRD
jgi:hypothetical protein